ncbi:MAG: nucleotide exchange factor GrpE [Planctomycetes bacterium GWF2_41_51]|nr:MAG: nucleotide exchange factor GrpE [Planctomycetes bacterium GWF2_41_51]
MNFNNENNLPTPLNTFSFCEVLFYIYLLNRLKSFEDTAYANCLTITKLNETISQLEKSFTQCLEITCACQKQTAELLNNNIERHALNPAIETVVFLYDEIRQLKSVSEKNAVKLSSEIDISLQLAHDKLAYLGIEKIMPLEGDCFDTAKHTVCGYEETEYPDLHTKINKTITPGILYRGKVITPARVKIYRYSKNSETIN